MRGVPLTPKQRQQIIDLRRTGHTYNQIVALTRRPYNTVAHVCRDEGLQHEPEKIIVLIRDPAGIFPPGPSKLNQADLSYMLALSGLQDGFTVTIGKQRLTVQDGCFIRSDGMVCPPNESGSLKWYKPAEAQAGKPEGAE